MTRRDAILRLLAFAQRQISVAPLGEQIELYQALSVVLPGKPAREQAAHIAWVLKEADRLQLDFSGSLFDAEIEASSPNASEGAKP